MPTYSFYNTETKEEFDQFMNSYSKKEEFLKENPHIESRITVGAPLVYEPGTNIKVPDSHKEAMARVKETYTINNIRE